MKLILRKCDEEEMLFQRCATLPFSIALALRKNSRTSTSCTILFSWIQLSTSVSKDFLIRLVPLMVNAQYAYLRRKTSYRLILEL